MMPLPPRYLLPVPLPTPFRPGDPRHLDPLGLHVRDTTDPHKVRDRLVDIGVLRKNGDGTYSPYLPTKADLVNGKVPASQLPEGQQGVTEVLVDGVSVVSGGTARINLTGKVDKEQGKGLSSNDYTAGEKQKLTGIEAGAQKNVAPVAPSTDASAAGKPADAKAAGDQLATKQPTISDLADIRAGAAAGAAAYQKPGTGIPATDLAASVQTSLGKADSSLQGVKQNGSAITPVGGVADIDAPKRELIAAPYSADNAYAAGEFCIYGDALYVCDVNCGPEAWTPAHWVFVTVASELQTQRAALNDKADAADLRYALDAEPRIPDSSGVVYLDDRTINRIAIAATIPELHLAFPDALSVRALDFLVRLELAANVTAPQIVLMQGITIENADGAVPTIATTTTSGDTAVTLLYFSETKAGHFLLKGEAVTEVA